MEGRVPAHLEISGLLRAVNGEGGFATILQRGERDAGTIMVVMRGPGETSRLYERMPQLDGNRAWTLTKSEDIENEQEFQDYLNRRSAQDRDLWLIELDIARAERFIGLSPPKA
ncbi:DUF1491 family protein [Croceicoccus hydrothermalis]|uniref:DUF1491 family protein n=1 Tax=Croceicoccus hydrothermalis TaxID=2867964 RepID=UPI001EFA4D4F|nr:DUF1491 family protein [Croceicoccus hydrothermalis]